MSDQLVTYVNDHLGDARIALQVLEAMRDQHDDQNFRDLASVLSVYSIPADHTVFPVLPRYQRDWRTFALRPRTVA